MTTDSTSRSPGSRPPFAPSPGWLALQDTVYGMFRAQMVFAVAELGIPDALASGPMTAAELAVATGTHERSLRRVMRALVSTGEFAEESDGRYALTEVSQLLRSGVPGSLRAMARYYGSQPSWTAWGALGHSLQTGDTAFNHVHRMGLFEFLGNHPALAELFNEFMSSLPLFAGAMLYDFSGSTVFVDVGGGAGNGMIPVLRAHPHLTGILVEVPNVAAAARAALSAAGLAERCEVVEGDFFQSVPAGGDVYLLSNVLHDWDDAACERILSNVRAAIPTNGRLLLSEAIIPPGNEPAPSKMIDIQMLVTLGGLQRTEPEYRELLASGRFELERILRAGPANLLVAAPAGRDEK